MITKIVLINFICIFVAVKIDEHLLNNSIPDHDWLIYPFGLWAGLSILSIPSWLIYLIWTW